MTVAFLTTVFMVRSLAERDCVPIVEGNSGARLERASIPQLLMSLMGSEGLQNLLKNAAHCGLVPCYDNYA